MTSARALVDGIFDHACDSRAASAETISSELHVAPPRIARNQRRGARRQLCHELVRDGSFDDDPLRGHADLPLVHECAEVRASGGFVQIGVL